MDQLVQCPVCTLFLHSGMSLEAHLDTHPKDQVIRALCTISGNKVCSQYGCRSFSVCDCKSERSYRSRSRTPVTDNHRRKLSTPVSHTSACNKANDRPSRPTSVISRSHTPAECYRNIETSQNVINLPSNGKFFGPINPERIVTTPIFIDNNSQEFTSPSNQTLTNTVDFGNKYMVISEETLKSNNKYSIADPSDNCLSKSNAEIALENGSQELFQTSKPYHKTVDNFENLNKTFPRSSASSNQCIVSELKSSYVSNLLNVPTFNHSVNNVAIAPTLEVNSSNATIKSFMLPVFSKPSSTYSQASGGYNTNVTPQSTLKDYNDGKTVSSNDGGKEHEPVSQPLVLNQNLMTFNSYSSANTTFVYPQHNFVGNSAPVQSYPNDISSNEAYHHGDYNYRPTSKPAELVLERPYILELHPMTRPNIPIEVTKDSEIITDNCGRMSVVSVSDYNFSFSDMERKGLKILSNIKVEVPLASQNSHSEVVDLTSTEVDFNQTEILEADQNSSQILFIELDNTNKELVKKFSSASKSVHVEPADLREPCASTNAVPESIDLTSGSIVNTFSVIKNIGNPNVKDSQFQKSFSSQETDIDQSIPDLTCNEKTISPCSELTNDSTHSDFTDPPEIEQKPKLLKKIKPVAINASKNYSRITQLKSPKKIEIKNSKFPNSCAKNSFSSTQIESNITSNSYFDDSKDSDPIAGPSKSIETGQTCGLMSEKFSEETSSKACSPIEYRSFENISKLSCESTIVENTAIDSFSVNSDLFKNKFSDSNVLNMQSLNIEENFADGQVKEFIQLDNVRPVKVIAYGNLKSGMEPSRLLQHRIRNNKETSLSNLIGENYFNDSVTDYFNVPENYQNESLPVTNKDNVSFFDLRRDDKCYNNEKENAYTKEDFPRKDYAIGGYNVNLQTCDGSLNSQYNYDRTDDQSHVISSLASKSDVFIKDFDKSDDFKEDIHKREVISDEKSNDDQEMSLNICADERMPPRGELSGQESNGDMDTPWEGIYHGGSGSTAYDLLARETWTSDASDNEMPGIQCHERDNDSEEMPIVVSVKPPEKNYKCATCGESFNCPKERRVHRAKEHPTTSTANVSKTKVSKKLNRQSKTPVPIKNEKPLDADSITSLIQADLNILSADKALNMKLDQVLPDVLESLDQKPKIEPIIKEEPKRRRGDYRCQMCKEDFVTEVLFREHLKIHPLECLTCGKYFYKRANLHMHIKRHLGIKHFSCNTCDKRFHTRQKLSEHLNIHTGENPIKCNLCDETFRRYSNLLQHRNRHHLNHPRKVRDFVCHCGEIFHSRKKLLWHKEIHDDRPKNCHYCSEKFIHMASLTRHIRRAHNNYFVPDEKRKKENVECAICKQVYLKNTIEMHLRTHSDKKPFSCVICNKSFKVKWNLQLHRWTHANRSSKPYKCNLCKGAFLRHTEYVSHMNSHKAVKPYTCNYCGCRFIRKYNCRRHVQEHENEKKFVCEVADCGKSFHRSYYLADHMKVHSGARPFSCNICGKTSSTKSNHNKHIKIHHAREPVATEA